MLETHPRAVSSSQTVSSSPKFMDNLQGHLVRGCSDHKRHLGLGLSLGRRGLSFLKRTKKVFLSVIFHPSLLLSDGAFMTSMDRRGRGDRPGRLCTPESVCRVVGGCVSTPGRRDK